MYLENAQREQGEYDQRQLKDEVIENEHFVDI